MCHVSIRAAASAVVLGTVLLAAGPAWAIDGAIPAIGGDFSRTWLGDGTGVIVAVMDSGIDDTHPALAGNDSLGNPRMLAEGNFVPTEPGNTGDDVAGHGTAVASAAMSGDGTYMGMAPDARYVNARVLDSGNSFDTGSWVRNGVGFAVDQGADVMNLSLNFFSASFTSGMDPLDLMLDWAAYDRNIASAVCVGNISGAKDNDPTVRRPASLFNGLSVGRTDSDYDQVASDSSIAYTSDGRVKPTVVAPGQMLTLANDDHETRDDWTHPWSGCSFATPIVAGLLAQQIDHGRANGLSTDVRVLNATIMNSADKSVLDKSGQPWAPAASSTGGGVTTVTAALDTHMGSGQIDGEALFAQYSAGQQAPGAAPGVELVGWDLREIAANDAAEYRFNRRLPAGSPITATLTWLRHVGRVDDGDGIVDAGDSFSVLEGLDNLDLEILRDGVVVARSVSTVDNVEQLHITTALSGWYTVRVRRIQPADQNNASETYALAWTSIPEPATLSLLALAALPLIRRRRR